VSAHRSFDPERDGPLLSGFADGELDSADRLLVEAWLADDERAREELARLVRLKAFTDHLALRQAPSEAWEEFRDRKSYRRERTLAWLLLTVAACLFGGYLLIRLAAILMMASIPIIMRLGVFVGGAGLLVLLISVLRERVFTRKRERYDDVVR
jgi:anti-sigma factor RsiW